MSHRWLPALLLLLVIFTTPAYAGHMSTYIEGTVIKKTRNYWVIQTDKGKYWVDVRRHPSFTRKVNELKVGFWVQVRHVKRVRANTATAANPIYHFYVN